MKEPIQYLPINGFDELKSSSEAEDEHLVVQKYLPIRRPYHCVTRLAFVLAAMVALSIYTTIVVSVTCEMAKKNRRHGTRFLSSPASDYITYDPHIMERWEYSSNVRYFGEPDEQIDRNWHELFEHQNIGFSAEFIHKIGRAEEGIKLPDGTYFGSLMVFHHLHCLKNIYHALHPAYYKLDILEEHEKTMLARHTDHCLHMVKEAIMCQADTTALTMKWDPDLPRPVDNLSSPHECVNWERLMEWVIPNSVDVFADGMLVHPTLGPPFKDRKPTEGFVDILSGGGNHTFR